MVYNYEKGKVLFDNVIDTSFKFTHSADIYQTVSHVPDALWE